MLKSPTLCSSKRIVNILFLTLILLISCDRDKDPNPNVESKNLLITYDIPNGTLETDPDELFHVWIIAHDKDWNIITSGELKPGKKLELIAPDSFTEKSFTLTTVFVEEENGKPYISGSSRLQYPKGMYVRGIIATGETTNDEEGYANLSFKNVINESGYQISTNGALYGIDSNRYNSKINIYTLSKGEKSIYVTKSPSKLYIRENGKVDNKFYLTNAVLDKGSSYALDLNLVNNASASNILEKEIFDIAEEREFLYVTLFGLPSSSDFKEAYDLGTFNGNNNKVTLQYPKASTNTFAQYFSITEYSAFNDSYDVVNAGFGKYNPDPLAATGTFQNYNDSTAMVTTSGEFDFFATFFFTDNDIENDLFTIRGPAVTNLNVKMPPLPTAITEQLSFVDFSAYKLAPVFYFIDYKSVANYVDFITQSNNPNFVPDIEQRSLDLNLDLSIGGRKESTKRFKSLKPILFNNFYRRGFH